MLNPSDITVFARQIRRVVLGVAAAMVGVTGVAGVDAFKALYYPDGTQIPVSVGQLAFARSTGGNDTAAMQAKIDAAAILAIGLPVGRSIQVVVTDPTNDRYIDGLIPRSGVRITGNGVRLLKFRNGFDVPSNSMIRSLNVCTALSGGATLTFTGTPSAGDTAATLTGNWGGSFGAEPFIFPNGDIRNIVLTPGALTATWKSGLSAAPGLTTQAVQGTYFNQLSNFLLEGFILDTNSFTNPNQILSLVNCEDYTVRDVTIVHRTGQNWATQFCGNRFAILNVRVLNGSLLFQDAIHVGFCDEAIVDNCYGGGGDDGLAVGIDCSTLVEPWNDLGVRKLRVSNHVLHAQHGSVKLYVGLCLADLFPLAGANRGRIFDVDIQVNGACGLTSNGGVYIEDTTQLKLTAVPALSATGGTLLNGNWIGLPTTTQPRWAVFDNGDVRAVTLTPGSPSVTWAALNGTTACILDHPSLVDPTQIQNITVRGTLAVGSISNDGANSAGVYILGATNVKLDLTLNITDTASGTHFSAGYVQLCMGFDGDIRIPKMPAGKGFSFYNCRDGKLRGRLVGGAGSGRGSVEQTGCQDMKFTDLELIDIPTNGSGYVVQSTGSGDFSNTAQLERVSMRKAAGATGTRAITLQNFTQGFMPYLSIINCDWRGKQNSEAIDAAWNSAAYRTSGSFSPDVLVVRDVRCVIPAFTVNYAATPTIPAVVGLKIVFTAMSGDMALTSPATNSVQSGQELWLEFATDTFAAGTRNVTFDGSVIMAAAAWVQPVPVTDASKKSRVTLRYDGTSYLQAGANRWV